MSEEICRGCVWKPSGGSCLVWKYMTPEICKEVKDEIANMPLRFAQSIPREYVNVVKVLCGFDYSADPEIKPTGTYYKYSKIESVLRDGILIKSSTPITEQEYEAFIREEK